MKSQNGGCFLNTVNCCSALFEWNGAKGYCLDVPIALTELHETIPSCLFNSVKERSHRTKGPFTLRTNTRVGA